MISPKGFHSFIVPALLAIAPGRAFAAENLIVNPGFALPPINSWTEFAKDWPYQGGIALTGGGVYLYEGSTISQFVPTTPGFTYRLFFDLAGNRNVGGTSDLLVHWGDTTLPLLQWNPATSWPNLQWDHPQFDLVASASLTKLTFENPYPEQSGRLPLIKQPQLIVIPEPSISLLFSISIAVLIFHRTAKLR